MIRARQRGSLTLAGISKSSMFAPPETQPSVTHPRIEWYSALCMIGWGLIIMIPGTAIEAETAYGPLIYAGWTEPQLAVVLCVAGTLWCIGLYINGHHSRSPVFRAIAALAGFVVWGHASVTLIEYYFLSGRPSAMIASLLLLAWFDLLSVYRNVYDAYIEYVLDRHRGNGGT